jgi:RNA polymerase sigma-70 factor (ECF subfamily)
MDRQRDCEIARGLRDGRTEAWTALYETHYDSVWRSVARLLGPDSADLADVVQETFLAAARSARTYDPARGSLRLWLAGIARNHAGTCLRNRRRHERIRRGGDLFAAVAEQIARWLADRDPTPPEALATAESAAVVRAVLSQMPDGYRDLLVARYCDGASVEEIAALQESTSTAIRSKLSRARRAFREAFAKWSTSHDEGQAGGHHEP